MTRKFPKILMNRAVVLATMAAFAVTMAQPSMAASPTAKSPTATSVKTGTSDVTDFSSQRRRVARRGGGYGGAAAAAAVAGIVGTAIIASQSRGYGYDRGYGYGGGPYDSYAYSPGYYGGGQGYYGGGYGRDPSSLGGQGYNGRPVRTW